MSRSWRILLLVVIFGVALDLLTKQLVLQHLQLGVHITVIKGFFNLVHVHNRGSAFGLFRNLSLDVVRVFFVITTGIVLAVVSYLWWRLSEEQTLAALGYSLIMAGALGNLVDRAFRMGEVVDFLDFYWGCYHWTTFNVADTLICIGAGLLVLVILREDKRIDASSTV